MENNISLKDLMASFRKNLFYFILIYLVLYFFAYIIDRFSPYEHSSENIYLEYKVYPIQPVEESSISESLTFNFNNTLNLDPSKTFQKKLYTISAERILNDFLISLSSERLLQDSFEENNFDRDLMVLIQDNVSVEVSMNPLGAAVSINQKNYDNIDRLFFSFVSNAINITQDKVTNLVYENIENSKNQLKQRIENIKKLNNMQNEIDGYNLLLKTAEINYENLNSFDFSFINSTDFIKIGLKPKKILGLKRYSIDLTSLSILFSTIICIIILFLRARKI